MYLNNAPRAALVALLLFSIGPTKNVLGQKLSQKVKEAAEIKKAKNGVLSLLNTLQGQSPYLVKKAIEPALLKLNAITPADGQTWVYDPKKSVILELPDADAEKILGTPDQPTDRIDFPDLMRSYGIDIESVDPEKANELKDLIEKTQEATPANATVDEAAGTISRQNQKILDLQELLNDAGLSAVQAAFSFGIRSIGDRSYYQDAYLVFDAEENRHILQSNVLDKRSFSVSTSLLIYPWIKQSWPDHYIEHYTNKNPKLFARLFFQLVKNSGFAVNLNLFDISSGDGFSSIVDRFENGGFGDGGIGWSLYLGPDVSLNITKNFFSFRALRPYYAERVGQAIDLENGETLTELDSSDDTYFAPRIIQSTIVQLSIRFGKSNKKTDS